MLRSADSSLIRLGTNPHSLDHWLLSFEKALQFWAEVPSEDGCITSLLPTSLSCYKDKMRLMWLCRENCDKWHRQDAFLCPFGSHSSSPSLLNKRLKGWLLVILLVNPPLTRELHVESWKKDISEPGQKLSVLDTFRKSTVKWQKSNSVGKETGRN